HRAPARDHEPARRGREHGGGHRTQPRRHSQRGLDHRHGARGRQQGWRGDVRGNAEAAPHRQAITADRVPRRLRARLIRASGDVIAMSLQEDQTDQIANRAGAYLGLEGTRPYAGAGWHYAEYRERVGAESIAILAKQLGWSTSDRVLDLGAGPGQLSLL